jgi:hypothetical protein
MAFIPSVLLFPFGKENEICAVRYTCLIWHQYNLHMNLVCPGVTSSMYPSVIQLSYPIFGLLCCFSDCESSMARQNMPAAWSGKIPFKFIGYTKFKPRFKKQSGRRPIYVVQTLLSADIKRGEASHGAIIIYVVYTVSLIPLHVMWATTTNYRVVSRSCRCISHRQSHEQQRI